MSNYFLISSVHVFSITVYSMHRLVDAEDEPIKELPPIKGYETLPLVSLEKAVEPLLFVVQDVRAKVSKIRMINREAPDAQLHSGSNGLTMDESAALQLFIMEDEQNDLYSSLNSALRSESRMTLRPWFPYLRLLLTASFKLPSRECVVWRAVRGDVSQQYIVGESRIWWGFSSCTSNTQLLERCSKQIEAVTTFSIECIKGKCIRAFAADKDEYEILLMPGTYLKVLEKFNLSNASWIIYLREEIAPQLLLAPPFTQMSSNHRSKLRHLLKTDD